MKYLKNRYYYNVNECLNGNVNGQRWKDFDYDAEGIFSERAIEYQMSEWTDFISNTDNAIAKNFVENYLSLLVYEHCFCSEYFQLHHDNELNHDYKVFLARFLSWWKESYFKYSKLIELYEDNKTKLMEGAKSISTSTSAGTTTSVSSAVPTSTTYQSYPSNTDDVAEGSHDATSSSVTTTNEAQSEDLIDHLDKLNDKIRSLYSEWVKTFANRFIMYVGD